MIRTLYPRLRAYIRNQKFLDRFRSLPRWLSRNRKNITGAALIIGQAFAATTAIFIAFPLFDYIRTGGQRNTDKMKGRNITIERIIIPQKKKEKKKIQIKKIKPKPMQARQKQMAQRFRLNLSAQGAGGTGAAIANTGVIEYEAGQTDEDARPASLIRVSYPDAAKKKGIEGQVILRALINERGRVEKLVFKSGIQDYGLKEAAMRALYATRFTPAKLKSIPVRQWVEVPITFSLN